MIKMLKRVKEFLKNSVIRIISILQIVAGYLICPKKCMEIVGNWMLRRLAFSMNGKIAYRLIDWVMNRWIMKIFIRFLHCTKMLWVFFKILKLFEKSIAWWIKYFVPDDVADELAEELLKIILKLMGKSFELYPGYKYLLKDFDVTFLFRGSTDKPFKRSIAIIAEFSGGKLITVNEPEELIPFENREYKEHPLVTVIFDNGKTIFNYLIATKKDMSKMIMDNEVVVWGNWGYLMRFQYMINHFILQLGGTP